MRDTLGSKVLTYGLLAVFVIMVAVPLFWMVTTAIKTNNPGSRGSGRVRGFLLRQSSRLCRCGDLRYDGTSRKPCRRGASWLLQVIRSVR